MNQAKLRCGMPVFTGLTQLDLAGSYEISR
jgi:hypothetical protein